MNLLPVAGDSGWVQEVIVIGGKAMMSKKFSLEQAEYVAAAMITAITLAKQANNQ